MNVEGFGDGADGFPLLDEFEGQFLLITAKLTRTAEGDPAFAGVDETVLSALSDEGALELGHAGEDGQYHAAGRRERIRPWLVKRL